MKKPWMVFPVFLALSTAQRSHDADSRKGFLPRIQLPNCQQLQKALQPIGHLFKPGLREAAFVGSPFKPYIPLPQVPQVLPGLLNAMNGEVGIK
jgi:hypothetical protein